jgi:subtilisin family serine protease
LIPVQVIRQDGAVEVVSAAYIAQGIRYAAAAGASVLSLSANVETVDDIFSVRDALNDLRDGPSSRVLVVNSAGNDLYGNLNGIAFPARYSGVYPFVVGVGATDRCGALKTKIISPTNCDTQTNWGSRRDDIDGTLLAPGVEITTTSNVQVPHDGSNPKNYRRNFSGTSAAAPFVAGVAAMLFAAHPNWTAQQVRTQLMEGSDHIPGTPHRRLNACAVLGTCAAIVSAVH